jgi:hypothetical protein
MNADESLPLDHSSHEALGRLRFDAAGLVKGLIRARITQEPRFLSFQDRKRWKVEDASLENRPCARLLMEVRALRERFESKYLSPPPSSIADPTTATSEELFDCVIDLVAVFFQGDFEQAIVRAARREKVDWKNLAAWDSLAEIRDMLDRLPEPRTGAQGPPDGPQSPDEFYFEGNQALLTPVPFRLVDHLWKSPHRTTDIRNLAGTVWLHHATEITKGMIGSARTQVNKAFQRATIPLRVEIVGTFAKLVDPRPS